MEKIRTTIYLNKDIVEFCKQHKINKSDWFETNFRDSFFGINSKVKRLEEIKQEEERIKAEIKIAKERSENLALQLTDSEKRYFYSVPEKLKNGADLKSVHNFFNYEFKRSFDFDCFLMLYKKHEKVSQDRYEYALQKLKDKKR
jgi:hypothetical protein